MDRKQAKNDYKTTPRKSGVYAIRNNSEDRIFVSGSSDLEKVWNGQSFQLKCGAHKNPQLQQDWARLGPEAFSFEVLEEVDPLKGQPASSAPNQEVESTQVDPGPTEIRDLRRGLMKLAQVWREKLQESGHQVY